MTRMRRAWQRVSTDGRIPRPTWDLYSTYVRLKTSDSVYAVLGWIGHVFAGRGSGDTDVIRPAGDPRSWQTSRTAPSSAFQIAQDNARSVVDTLSSHGIRPFLIEADDLATHFGLSAELRETALQGLRRLDDGPWYICWTRGGRTHTQLLRNADRSRAVKAESWELFRLFRTGQQRLLGRSQRVLISFWAESESGLRERLGYRGLSRFDPDTTAETTEIVAGNEYPGLDVFPVAQALGREERVVDFVYTWVDDGDPAWRREFDDWAGKIDEMSDQAAHPARFRSLDELRYSLRSVWLYAGWFNHIYLVTSGQVPDWLQEHPRLTVVPHREIMPDSALPTFNSHAIEASLHLIPGLAENFVYMNDDVVLARPLGRDRFFTDDGRLRYVESEAMMPVSADALAPAVELAAINNRHAIQRVFARTVKWRLDHAPHALLKSVMEEAHKLFEAELKATVSHRLRHPDDLSLASGLCQFIAACTGRGVPADIDNRYMNVENERLAMFLDVLGLDDRVDSFCLNQTDATGSDAESVRRVSSFLSSYFSSPAPWEAS